MTPAEIAAARAALHEAIVSGVRVVEYADRKVEYRSLVEMQRALTHLNQIETSVPARRTLIARTSKGY
jgi:hypothetical protein